MPDAYLVTELSWWTGFVGRVEFMPPTPWFLMAFEYLGDPAIARSKPLRRGLLAGSIALQPIAIVLLWFVGYP